MVSASQSHAEKTTWLFQKPPNGIKLVGKGEKYDAIETDNDILEIPKEEVYEEDGLLDEELKKIEQLIVFSLKYFSPYFHHSKNIFFPKIC